MEAARIESHAAAVVTAADELLNVTRSLKEAWLLGHLGGANEMGSTDKEIMEKEREMALDIERFLQNLQSNDGRK